MHANISSALSATVQTYCSIRNCLSLTCPFSRNHARSMSIDRNYSLVPKVNVSVANLNNFGRIFRDSE